ncbi:MAG: gliding motility protein GldM, partial [Muribaculaceae bacterium]|nr:gliding motility protein GldM [Muribaculaceae bacterium]
MAANSSRLTPRQKMINLMYIVLTAMLALNVSSDVLDGFKQVHDGLSVTNSSVADRNTAVYRQLESFAATNPEKGQQWLDKASEVRRSTAALNQYVDSLKLLIVRKADGKDGDPDNIINRDDLEAASVVMLAPGNSLGKQLRERIDAYRAYINGIVSDPAKQQAINATLSTAPVQQAGTLTPKLWEEMKFEQQPAIAAVTILAKMQSDLLNAEGEALGTLLSQVDAGDVRVNELNAYVLPQSRLVMRGGKYSANIVLAAIDTTARPTVYIGGKQLSNDRGLYE